MHLPRLVSDVCDYLAPGSNRKYDLGVQGSIVWLAEAAVPVS